MAAVLAVGSACSNSTLPDSAGQRVLADGSGYADAAGYFEDGTTLAEGTPGATPGAAGGGTAGGPSAAGGRAGSSRTNTASGDGARASGGGGPSGPAGSVVGVTKTQIKIAVSAPFSGPLAAIMNKGFTNGMQTWQETVNAAGGIHGRKVVLVKVDNQYTAAGAIAACKEIKSNGVFMNLVALGFTSETDCEDEAGIPVFDANPTYLKPWKYVIPMSYLPAHAAAEVSFLKSSYMNAFGKRIGVIYNGDAAQTVAEYEAVNAELKKQGFDVVAVEKFANNQASFVAEMQRMQQKDVEVVLQYAALEGASIVRDARAIGFNPVWYSGPTGTATDTVSRAGNEQLRGLRALRIITTTETPAYADFVAKVRRVHGDGAMQGVDTNDANAYAMIDVLGKILDTAGPNLTRESVMTAARSIENYNNGLFGPFTLKGRQVGLHALYPVECCKSDYTYKSLGPPAERFS